ncbi:hypothetical protein [Spiroplasma tabanidicola]|uniref:ABC transporter permease n=1 Tax=Spiroplasma tabanidicola TaxID=324079 RepID=A0A6I6C9Q0_9MOLU|nr:hypothetical protein [Spiroplasma tabanidicola]QGS52179.1 hypothetical protein STABA_v1c08240 [Spiroplasma tabanidicola]
MKFKSEVSNFNKVFRLLAKGVFLNYKTYFYTYVISIATFILVFIVWFKNSANLPMPPFIVSIITSCVFFSSMYIGLVVIDWKKRNYLVKLKIGEVNRISFLLSVFFINLIISTTNIILNIITYNILVYSTTVVIHNEVLQNLKWYIWILYILCTFIFIMFLTAINLLLTSITKNVALSIFFVILFLIFSLSLSDSVVQPSMTSNFKVFRILGYLNPAKYFVWFTMLVTSYSIYDIYGLTQIIPDYFYGSPAPFWNIYQTLIPAIIFLGVSLCGYYFLFKWGYKL